MHCIIFLFQIKAFKQFRMWKGFYVWRKYCLWRKFCIAQDALEQNHVILNPVLQKGVFNIQAMCCSLVDMSFTDVSKMEENALFEFIKVQVFICTKYLFSLLSVYVIICAVYWQLIRIFYLVTVFLHCKYETGGNLQI